MFVRFNYGAMFHYVNSSDKTVCGQSLHKPGRDLNWSTDWNTAKSLQGNYFTGTMLCDHCAKRLPVDTRGMIRGFGRI